MTPEAVDAPPASRFSPIDVILWALFGACIARLWLMALPASLWVDEMVTDFVIHRPNDPSFAIAPQVPESLYYWLPRVAVRVFGNSEIALRIPSLVAITIALYFICRVTARLISPEARWLAAALCLALVEFDHLAVDARPYALGIAVSSASLFFLIRWLDQGRWIDTAAFVVLAAILWQVHLLYWPFYLLYPGYFIVRVIKGECRAQRTQIIAATLGLAVALAPVASRALKLNREATSHAFNAPPGILEFVIQAGFVQLSIVVFMALFFHFGRRWKRESPPLAASSLFLILGWWLVCPVGLTIYSVVSNNGVLIPRYASLMLPGVALTAAVAITRLVPLRLSKHAAVVTALVSLLTLGQWTRLWPSHGQEGWREAAALERQVATEKTPVLFPSPFIEAVSPVWTPNYHLPGFLYANLTYYPLTGLASLFPFNDSPQADQYAANLLHTKLLPASRFMIVGLVPRVEYLYRWFAKQPELVTWHADARNFDGVVVVLFSEKLSLDLQ